MKTSSIITGLTAFVFLVVATCPALGWGPEAHTLITLHAIAVLPDEIKPFYRTNERYVAALVTLPDDWRETHKDTGPQHFFDLDLFDKPPFKKVRGTRKEVEKRFGKNKVLEMGLLPWTIEERFNRLVKAMRTGNGVEIVVQSALLAHFVGDAHVPFHATKFYDGKKPEQKGLHFRWETNLVALHLKPESLKPRSPKKIENVLSATFDWLAASNSYVDALCEADNKARDKDPVYGYRYFASLADYTMSILEERLSSAATNLASIYITAWEKAGRPKLPDKPALLYWGH
jgi:hypothetical protein